MTTIITVLLAVLGGVLVVAYALWDFGADRLLASFGCAVVRVVTIGRVRISADGDYPRAMAVSAMTLIGIFIVLIVVASRVH